jgi:hypothetical protein
MSSTATTRSPPVPKEPERSRSGRTIAPKAQGARPDSTCDAQRGRPGLAVQAGARCPAAGINADYLEPVLLHAAIAFGGVFQDGAQAWGRHRFVYLRSKILPV